MSYERKSTIPRSHGNVSHKRNSWHKASELGTRLIGSRDRQKRPGRGETKITERGGGGTRQERTIGGEQAREESSLCDKCNAEALEGLIVGAVRSVLQFKAVIPTVAQRTGERSPQPISTADANRNRSGHLHTVSLVPKEPDFGTKGRSGLSQSLCGVNTWGSLVGAKGTEKGPWVLPCLSLK